MPAPWKKSYDKPRWYIKKQRHYFTEQSSTSRRHGSSSSHVRMSELDHKEGWVPKNLCFWTVTLEKTLENPLDYKEIKPVNSKGNKHWIFIGKTGTEAEAPVSWPPDAKSWLTGKDPDGRERLNSGERGQQGWDGWMASLIQWTWV